MRQCLGSVLIVFMLSGCSNEIRFERTNLSAAQSQDELRHLGVSIPDGYTFISMTKTPPPGSGSSSYDGVYEARTPPAPVTVDGNPLSMKPTTCQDLPSFGLPDGLDCSLVQNISRGSIKLTKSMDYVGVVSTNLGQGTSRIYVSVAGH